MGTINEGSSSVDLSSAAGVRVERIRRDEFGMHGAGGKCTNGDEEVEASVEEKGKELGNDRSSRTMHEDRGSCPRADARWERDGVRRDRGHTPHWTER